MPKPTFFQSVLRKPTRSYADSGYGYGGDRISPYADPQPDHVPVYAVNHYGGSEAGSAGGSNQGSHRRKKKVVQPAVSHSELGLSRRQLEGEAGSIPFPPSSSSTFPKPKSPSTFTARVSAPNSVKGKARAELSASATIALDATQDKRGRRRASNAVAARERDGQLTPPSSVSASGSGSSLGSFSRTRFETDRQLPKSSLQHSSSARGIEPEPVLSAAEPLLALPILSVSDSTQRPETNSTADDDSDSSDIFYTPRSSLSSTSLPRDIQPETPSSQRLSHPAFSMNLLPPTPAPVLDSKVSPFQSSPGSAEAKPIIPPKSHRRRSSATSSAAVADVRAEAQATRPAPVAESVAGEAGSVRGDYPVPNSQRIKTLSPAHSRSSSFVTSDSSVPFAGSASGMRPAASPNRVKSSKNSFNDFVVHPHRRPSLSSDYESSSRPPSRAASVYSMPAGPVTVVNGGGGWAIARSGASSPVPNQMRMPARGSTGFEDFHVPIPANLVAGPKRQSRFTPLPPKSASMRLEQLRTTEVGVGTSRLGENSANVLLSRTPSSASEYSQPSVNGWGMSRQMGEPRDVGSEQEEDEEWDYGDDVRPSRSYAAHHDQQRTPTPGHPGALAPADYQFSPPSRLESRTSRSSRPTSPGPQLQYLQRSLSPAPSVYSVASRRTSTALDAPSVLDPSALTFLPELPISVSLSDELKEFRVKRASSMLSFGGGRRSSLAPSDNGDQQLADRRRTKSVVGMSRGKRESIDLNGKWDGSSYGEGVLLGADGTVDTSTGNYSSLILPTGAYKPSLDPTRTSNRLDHRVLGMPHATMCSIALSSSAHLHSRRSGPSATPAHLRGNLPSPVDFSSQHKPPGKVGDTQVLVQVYAVAIDHVDVEFTSDKSKGEVGKWVPGRSFVGRCIATGAEERDIVRGDLVMGLLEVRKSGALAEYLVCDRRRLARVPVGTQLTIEQIACLPLYGIPAHRAVQTQLIRGRRALILDAHLGVGALMCQLLAKSGVTITAIIPGGNHDRDAQAECMANGARGVLVGDALTIMEGLDDNAWDFVLDSVGGRRAFEAARRILKEGGQLASLWPLESDPTSTPYAYNRPSSFSAIRAAFSRRDSKYINYSYLAPAGTGGADVDPSGQDTRDVLEQPSFNVFRPTVDEVLPFERGAEAFVGKKWRRGAHVIKIVE